jgi:hypothetical protein
VRPCALCGDVVPIHAAIRHLRVIHLDAVDEWPDGSPVIVDTTLEPGDFT